MKQKTIILAIAFLTFFFALCSSAYSQTGLQGQPFFRMQIESVTESPGQVIVETTGAKYVLSGTGMEMWRKIDPEINDVNPKKVAKLAFDTDVGTFTVISKNKGNAEITSTLLDFNFISDSFFIIKAKVPFSYTHTNLIQNAPWNKGSGLDRIWTDGYGGSLHAWIRGSPTKIESDTDHTKFSMNANDEMAHMVFPPKKFDFEGLYGQNARPFVHFISSPSTMEGILSGDYPIKTVYADKGIGVFMIWNTIYDCGSDYIECAGPVLLDSGVLGYKIKDDLEDTIKEFIELAHNNGFKVITYLSHPDRYQEGGVFRWRYPDGQFQDISITRAWMKKFQEEYKLDGWYFDNANAGDLITDYNFIRQVRADIGDDGIIYHHDSVDIWGWGTSGQYSGLRAIMINAYADYTLAGETGEIAEVDEPNDAYFRFFTAGYGMSQAYASHKRKSDMKVAISDHEKSRVLTENLHGAERNIIDTWLSNYKPFYDARKSEYLSGNFNPDIDWPINTTTGWFRYPTNIQVEFITGTLIRVSWQTGDLADSEVTATSNGVWWESQYGKRPDERIYDESLTTQHSITLPCLEPDKPYEFRIRSNNRRMGIDEVIWGKVVSDRTKSASSDTDALNDCWEISYFGNMDRSGSGDFDADGLSDLEEQQHNTDPTSKDSDADGFDDNFEITNGYDPLNWFDSPNTCKDNFICKEGLLGYWSFDFREPIDQSGNNNNGTAYGPQWIASGGYNGKGAYKFSGAGDYIGVGQPLANISTYGQQNRKSTITAWVKPTNASKYNVVTNNLGGFDYFSAGTTDTSNPGKLRTMIWDGSANQWPVSNKIISANEWTHLAFVFEEGIGAKFYINGEPAGETTNNLFAFYNYGGSAYIGAGFSGDSYFSGMIDEVTVWKRALNQEEILEIYTRHCGNSACEPAQGETAENCPLDCTQECIREPQLLGFIGQWKRGEISMLVLMQKIAARNAGTGCSSA